VSTILDFSSYQFREHEEYCLRAGSDQNSWILLVPPLFDEMNRARRMLADVMRFLDQQHVGSILPDLPGTNESRFPSEKVDLNVWREALTCCLEQFGQPAAIAAFRGGCLIDNIEKTTKTWRLAPVKGQNLLRTLMRTRIASDKEEGKQTTLAGLTEQAQGQLLNLAGNQISQNLFSDLQSAQLPDSENLRTVRLDGDSKPSDRNIPGSPLWLRVEPDSDEKLSAAIANDLVSWIAE
jgi:hypothetical protein